MINSYRDIKKLLEENQMVPELTVSRYDLEELVKYVEFLNKKNGILGWEDGRMLVNRIGIIPVIKDLFLEDHKEEGEPDEFKVTLEDVDPLLLSWKVEATYKMAHGAEMVCTTFYKLDYIMQRRAIKLVQS